MKKIIICNIPMKPRAQVAPMRYESSDRSLPVSERAVRYVINALLEETLKAEDEVKLLLLCKQDGRAHSEENLEDFCREFDAVNEKIGAKVTYKVIESDFAEEKFIHEELMGQIVDEIEEDTHILADITYGPKDLPIVLFAAMNFAERYLGCEIDHIVYSQADFVDGKVTQATICDMGPLYYLNSITNTIRVEDPAKARKMLKSLLSL